MCIPCSCWYEWFHCHWTAFFHHIASQVGVGERSVKGFNLIHPLNEPRAPSSSSYEEVFWVLRPLPPVNPWRAIVGEVSTRLDNEETNVSWLQSLKQLLADLQKAAKDDMKENDSQEKKNERYSTTRYSGSSSHKRQHPRRKRSESSAESRSKSPGAESSESCEEKSRKRKNQEKLGWKEHTWHVLAYIHTYI